MKGPFPLAPPRALAQSVSMFVHTDSDIHVSKRIAEEGIWEDYETALILDLLTPSACFVDVGANLGYYSVLAGVAVGEQGRVYAFEPEQKNFDLLERNIAHNGLSNIHRWQAALSDSDNDGLLYLNELNRGDHQVYQQHKDATERTTQDIVLRYGSRLLAAHDCTHIDVLKIDTQGAEWHVMTGLIDVVRNSLPNIKMIVEFCPYGLRQAGASGRQLLSLLAGLELPFYIIDHIGHGLKPETEEGLLQWIDSVDADPENEGFINLLLGQL